MLDESEILERLERVIAQRSGPVAEAEVAQAETTLGVSFPRSYRTFLTHFGAPQLKDFYEIAGLGTEPSVHDLQTWLHVVTTNMRLRRHMPIGYIRISDNGGDYSFFLDAANLGQDGECAVVVVGPGAAGVVVAQSFLDFVEKAAVDALEF